MVKVPNERDVAYLQQIIVKLVQTLGASRSDSALIHEERRVVRVLCARAELKQAEEKLAQKKEALQKAVAGADVQDRGEADVEFPTVYEWLQTAELSIETENCVKAGFPPPKTVIDLVTTTEAEMLRIDNFGRRALNEMQEVLRSMGLYFGMLHQDAENGWRLHKARR